MNLLYTLTAYPPSTGGAQLHQHLLAQQMQQWHSIQVVSQWGNNRTDWLLGTTLKSPTDCQDYTIDGVTVHRFGLSRREKIKLVPSILMYYAAMDLALPPIVAGLGKHIAPYAARADLIHNMRFGREGLSYASLQCARRRNIPFVFTPIHHPRWVGWRYRAFIKLYSMADAVFALTNAEKQILMTFGVQEDHIHVIGHGPVLEAEARPLSFTTKHQIDGPIVLFLGQHYPYKGYRQLLSATQIVWKKVPDTHFVFIGPAVGESERDFAPYLDRRIHRLGNVDVQTKTDALAACTLLCVPSTQESFGGVFTEAWSFEKPVIGCNIPAVSEVISDGIDGFLVAQDAQQIADRIFHLLLHPIEAGVMGIAGRHKVETKYAWPRIAERAEAAYRKTLGGQNEY